MSVEILPLQYKYLITEAQNNILRFRIREVKDGISAKKWIKNLCESSNIVWRIGRTYPAAGRVNIFRIHLRCQHATDRRAQGIKKSKNTDCPAYLNLTVKRFVKHSKSKKIDPLITDWPTICTLNNNHNHSVEGFMHGHLSNEHEIEDQKLCDDSNSFLSSFGEENKDCYLIESSFTEEFDDDYNSLASSLNEEYVDLPVTFKIEPPEKDLLNEHEENEFETLLQRMIDGYRNEPHIFVPAIKRMIKNSKEYASTNTELASAMRNFGLQCGFAERIDQQYNKSKTDVQPRVTANPKLLLPEKKRLGNGPVTVYLVSPNSNVSKELKELQS